MLALLFALFALACSPSSDTAIDEDGQVPRRIEVVIPQNETVEILPLLPVGGLQCDGEGLCVSYTPDLRLRLGVASVTAPEGIEVRLYWWE